MDLHTKKIISYTFSKRMTVDCVLQIFNQAKLTDIHYFHTDRGKEFNNQAIDQVLTAFGIERSLSRKGSPHDNAVAESTYKSTKVEFVYPNTFATLHELDVQLFDYVHWWNNLRLHGSLGYETPTAYRTSRLAKRILDNELGYDTNEGAA